jgi:hypothetical protein
MLCGCCVTMDVNGWVVDDDRRWRWGDGNILLRYLR